MARGLVAALALALLAAPARAADVQIGANGVFYVNGEPTFLIGLSPGPPLGGLTPDGSDAWAEVATSGVRMFRYVPPSRWSPAMYPGASEFLDHAHAYDGVVWLGLRELARAQPGTPEEARLRDVIRLFADHPGMGLWRGIDEPWWSGVPANETAHAYGTIEQLDPPTPVMTIQAARGTRTDLAPYSAFTDVHGADPFPIRFDRRYLGYDLHMVGRWTRLMRSITPSRAVLMTLGICQRGAQSRDFSLFVHPTRRELRYQVFDAISNGARGLNFYGSHICLAPGDAELGWNWKTWFNALRPVLREIAPGSPLHEALVRPGTGVGLRVAGYRASVISRRTDTDLWVIVTRHSRGAKKQAIRISGLPRGLRYGKVYGKPRRVLVRNGTLTLGLGEWGVQVLRFPLP
jgi:hypothetical protein